MPRFGCSKPEPEPEIFDVVAKFCTVATNLLRFYSIGSDGVAFVLGASGVLGWDCDVDEGRI